MTQAEKDQQAGIDWLNTHCRLNSYAWIMMGGKNIDVDLTLRAFQAGVAYARNRGEK